MRPKSSHLPLCAQLQVQSKFAMLCIALISVLGLGSASTGAQTSPSKGSGVSRTAKAVTYRRGGGAAKVLFRSTDLMPGGAGEAKVENKGNRVEIEAKFEDMEEANKFGFEYLTYV